MLTVGVRVLVVISGGYFVQLVPLAGYEGVSGGGGGGRGHPSIY